MKILHLPTSVGGNSYGLSRAERKLGLLSDVMTIDNNYLDYPSDFRINISGNRLKKIFKKKYYQLFLNTKYNILHFNYGSCFFNVFEMVPDNFYNYFFNKKIKYFVTYNGCDCRQKYKIIKKYDISACANPGCYDGICNSINIDIEKEKNIQLMSNICNSIFYLNPDHKQFLPYKAVFLPYSIASWDHINYIKRKYNYPLKVVHAPSQRGAKGTEDILSIIDKIKLNYPDKIEFYLVEGLVNSEAIKIYEQADILIDQILIGWYGALSVEAMKAGCAVMVYIREEDLQYIPHTMHEDIKNTFINCTKFNLYEKIAEIIESPNILQKYNKYSIEYVNTWHNPEYVASITKESYGL